MESKIKSISTTEVKKYDDEGNVIKTKKTVTEHMQITFSSTIEALNFVSKLIGDDTKFRDFLKYGKQNGMSIWIKDFQSGEIPGKECLRLSLDLGMIMVLDYLVTRDVVEVVE